MRIKRISAKNIEPVQCFEVDDLSDLIVFAGPNGVGKTRLVQGLLNFFQNPWENNPNFTIEATSNDESNAWGKSKLETSDSSDSEKLYNLLTRNRRRRNFTSSIIYFESDRSIRNIKPLEFQFDYPDPWEEDVPWHISFGGLTNRWQDTQHAIFKKIQSQRNSIANREIQLRGEGHGTMNLKFADPLKPFKEAFEKLLGPKSLHRADVQAQRLTYIENSEERDINTLSSGEREVLNITFDFILRKPSHCIVFFDEPELHLHPEMLARLISTLRAVGENNQFILISHSPEVIASSLDDSVVFVTPPKDDSTNQAVLIDVNSTTADILHKLGQSVGVISLGKKVVLIEGKDSSLDKKTYSYILGNRFPELALLPCGGRDQLVAFNTITTDILDRSLWGISFYMLADRDASPSLKSSGRFRVLSRYHLENYFLNAEVLSKCFSEMEGFDSWLRSVEQIELKLREIARDNIGYAAALVLSARVRETIGNISIMPKGIHSANRDDFVNAFRNSSSGELIRVSNSLDIENMEEQACETYQLLEEYLHLDSENWKCHFPGKIIFSKFCNAAKMEQGRLKMLYLKNSSKIKDNPFKEIINIFENFLQG